MRSLLSIAIGQCGNSVGHEALKQIAQEDDLDPQGFYVGNDKSPHNRLALHFHETPKARYMARSIMVDLSPHTIDAIQSSHHSALYNPDNFITGKHGSGNNYGVARYTDGAYLNDSIRERIRSEVEKIESFHGAFVFFATGGGSGSGLGHLTLQLLRDKWCNINVTVYPVFPSEISHNLLEIYNTILVMPQLIEISDSVMLADNQALSNLSKSLERPKEFQTWNAMLAESINSYSSCMRYSGSYSTCLHAITCNLVPFPRLHFFVQSYLPFKGNDLELNIERLVHQKQLYSTMPNYLNRYYSTYIYYRGDFQTSEMESPLSKYITPVEWIPSPHKFGHSRIPHKQYEKLGLFIGNTTSMGQYFKEIDNIFIKLWRRKAFIWKYLEEGMDEMEFVEAESNFNDIISEYYDSSIDYYDPIDEDEEEYQESEQAID